MKKIVSSLFLVIFLAGISSAWVMTREFAREIAQKEAAVKNNPSSADAMFDMAITYAYTNKIQEGLDALKKTASLSGDVKKYSEKLVDRYDSLVRKSPSDWRLRFRLAFAYYFAGYKNQAIIELQKIALTEPGNPFPYGYMAVIYAEKGSWKHAITTMKRAIAIDSNVAAFHLGLGQAYYKVGNSMGGFMETAEALRLKSLGY